MEKGNEGQATSGANSSSLDTLETSRPLRASRTRAQEQLHKPWERERAHVLDALFCCHDADLTRRAARIDDCCSFPSVATNAAGKPCLILHRCKDRMCGRCQKQRGIVLASTIAGLVKEMNAPRFVTLTLSHKLASLSSELERLADGFRKLRKSEWWKRHVKGGIYVVQVTRNTATDRWHAHVHAIVDGVFMPQKQLSEEWSRATGGSIICDVRAVPDREKTSKYVASYVMKPAAVLTWDFIAVREFATAMKGRRLVHTFASLHGKKIDPRKDDEASKPTDPLCSLHRLTNWAQRGHAASQHAMETLASLGNGWRTAIGLPPLPIGHAWLTPSPGEIAIAIKTCGEVGQADHFPEPPPPIRETAADDVHWCSHTLWGEARSETSSAILAGL